MSEQRLTTLNLHIIGHCVAGDRRQGAVEMVASLHPCGEAILTIGRVHNPRFGVGYAGVRDWDETIWVRWYTYGRWRLLPMRNDLRNHSPDGFSWGYGGSGPAQLALSILCHALQNDDLALGLYQRFKWAIVGRLHRRRWHLTRNFVYRWVRAELDRTGVLCQLDKRGRVVVV